MTYAIPGASFEAVVDFGDIGLVGTIGVRVIDNVGNDVVARTTAGIIEDPASSGIYEVTLTAPAPEGQYSIVWDDGADHFAADDLVVSGEPVPGAVPVAAVGSVQGPCTGWITGDDVADCGDVGGSDTSDLDVYAAIAAELLYPLSGRQFAGTCGPVTVRPCRDRCGCFGGPLGSSTWYWGPGEMMAGRWLWHDECGQRCGCGTESYVRLNYPVREITQVKINGDVIDPSEYRVVRRTDLLRVSDPGPPVRPRFWPACQDVRLDDTEPGTFSILYTWGEDPPESGKRAAAQLAAELWRACNGQECNLPAGATKIVRQGVTIERGTLIDFLTDGKATGLVFVDSFLAAFNPNRLHRRPAVWSPDLRRYPQPVD